MRRVAFLSYYFPPIGGAGAQRPARFVRHLPSLGYEPVVVTGPGAASGRWTPRDEDLDADIPPEIDVLRLDGPEPPESAGRRARAERWLELESPWSRWWIDGAVETGRRAGDVDVVYAWMSPFETTEAAARLARELGAPWVADLGDPWALDEMMVYPSRLHRLRTLARMRRELGSAAAIVMSTPEAVKRLLEAFPELRDKAVVAIPNGYDAADFEGPPPARADDAFRIVHTGYLHTELGRRHRRSSRSRRILGGTVAGVDFLTRSHVYLLDAIDRLVERDPTLASRIELHLAGVLSQADRESGGRSDVVRMLGYVPHDESVALMRSADLLFLPMHDLPPGVRAGIVPGKTYEYLASGRPILAAVPDGDARDILAEAGNAFLCRPADSDAMAGAVSEAVERRRAGDAPAPPRPDVVERYEYGRLARDLAGVFDRAAGGARSLAGVRG
jgi:glycosyltransferase involved in cell wall biosynthesis